MTGTRLERQIAFLAEIDKLKQVLRRTSLIGEPRLENSAEHSWHLAIMAPIFAEYASAEIDLGRAMRMLLVHDVVEIDAGDTFAFDVAANADKEERERQAAERLFGLLPEDQAAEVRALWDEFEEGATPEARFANALDRFQGLLLNVHNQGGTWKQYGITREQIMGRMDPIREGAPPLWPYVLEVVDRVMSEG